MSQIQEQEPVAEQIPDGDAVGSGTRNAAKLSPPTALPTLVGIAVIILNVVVIFKQKELLVPNNLTSSVFVTLVGSSVLLGVFLLIYAKFLRRAGEEVAGPGKWFVRWVVVPLLVGTLAMFATFSSLATVNSLREQSASNAPEPCIQLYQQAAGIRDVSPRFRMPNNDRDERRCKINEAVLR